MMKSLTRCSAILIAVLFVMLFSPCIAASSYVKKGSERFVEPRSSLLRDRSCLKDLSCFGQVDFAQRAADLRGGASDAPTVKAFQGVVAMACIEAAVKRLLEIASIKFPSQLGGCIALFVVSLLLQFVSPGTGDSIYEFLLPGANLLAKWLPAFFVPGLAMLPLAPSVGSSLEVSRKYRVYSCFGHTRLTHFLGN